MRIGIVAAEPSGDTLAAGLMQAIRRIHPEVVFEGIGGPRMLEQGMHNWFAMEKLSVMGLVEVLKHLPELLGIRRELVKRWRQAPPDLFIGVDAPDFNLGLETSLRKQGVTTAHYVCPSVWAWREKRVNKIREAADLVLSIFPFEKDFLARHRIKASYVGHPLAQAFPLPADKPSSRAELSLTAEQPVLALLPGSRGSEIQYLSRPFLLTALECSRQLPGLRVLVPLVNDKTRRLFQAQLAEYAPELNVTILDAQCQAGAYCGRRGAHRFRHGHLRRPAVRMSHGGGLQAALAQLSIDQGLEINEDRACGNGKPVEWRGSGA